VSKHPERAERTARIFGIPNHSTELDLSRGWGADAEAIMIGTVPHAHYDLAKRALLAGKHVLTEKPMTIEIAHARELRELARERKLTIALVHNNQFGRAASTFKRLWQEGRLGRIRTVYGIQVCNPKRKLPAWTDDLPLGLYFDECPHFCYMFRFLAGGDVRLESATVWKSHGGGHPGFVHTPRMVSATYRADDGTPLFLHVDFEANLTEWQVAVTTEKATVLIDFWRDIYLYMPNDGSDAPKDLITKTLYATHQHFWGALAAGLRYVSGTQLFGNIEVVTRFHRAIHGEDCLQGMSAEEGVRVVEMQHELIQKARYVE
jgi:predicted dehydrogenase